MTKEEETTFDFAIELCQTKSVSNSTYALALNLFGEKTVVELTALVGYYTMVAMTLNAHEIPLPQGITPAFALPQESPTS
jgi:4-carboxymuconolactone decarboxylase